MPLVKIEIIKYKYTLKASTKNLAINTFLVLTGSRKNIILSLSSVKILLARSKDKIVIMTISATYKRFSISFARSMG